VTLDPTVRDGLIIAGVLLAVIAAVLALVALTRTRRMRRDYQILQGRDGEESFVEAVARKTAEVDAMRTELAQHAGLLQRTRQELADAIRHVSVVRYDAFGDMGGRLSFSAALLDDGGDGIVLTSIHARTETRTYIKGVQNSQSDYTLSPEEQQAVTSAMTGTSS
jgi:Protein of unknown function (DUF4446)